MVVNSRSALALLLLALATHGAAAQPGPLLPPWMTAPSDHNLLPGDWVLPQGKLPPMPPMSAKPPPEPISTALAPSLARSLRAAEAALAACTDDGHAIGVAVIDSVGQPRVGLSTDGAAGGHIYTAVRKGLAAIAFQMPTSAVGARMHADPASGAVLKPTMVPMAGAIPLFDHGKLIGAIGASGASSAEDEKCAAAGAATLR